MKVLISDPSLKWAEKVKAYLETNSLDVKLCLSGKDCQLEVYRGGVDCLLLNLDTTDYPGLMVLKYMRLNYPNVKVVLTVDSKDRLKELEINSNDLNKLGASSVLIKPVSDDLLFKTIKGDNYDSWKEITVNEGSLDDEKVTLGKDEEYTRVKLESVQTGNITIFDHYIRLGPGRYIKVLRRGDSFDKARMEKFILEKKVEYLYFKVKDRTVYINFMNALMQRSLNKGQGATAALITKIKAVTDMYIDEIYTSGLKPQLIDEGTKICQNMFQIVKSDSQLARYIRELQEMDSSGHAHLFMVSFFSTVICKNLDWAGNKTVETIAMGGLLHDIGKLKLPPAIRDKSEHEIPADQIPVFQQHPLFGVELLKKTPSVNDQIRQIVFQHHELVNGTGYPNALTGSKIYPLAKIIALSDGFSKLLTTQKISPIEGLKKFIPDKEQTSKYDSEAIKSLVIGLLR